MVAAFFLLLPAASHAAVLKYAIETRFDNDWLPELIAPDGTKCYHHQACYPTEYRYPRSPFIGLAYGEVFTASMTIDTDTQKVTCQIGEFNRCSSWYNLSYAYTGPVAPSQTTGAVSLRLGNSYSSDIGINLRPDGGGTISVGLDSGDWGAGPCTLAAPKFAGLPNGYCNFFYYEARFSVLSYQVEGLPSMPLPASLPMLLAGCAGVGVWKRRQHRKSSQA